MCVCECVIGRDRDNRDQLQRKWRNIKRQRKQMNTIKERKYKDFSYFEAVS